MSNIPYPEWESEFEKALKQWRQWVFQQGVSGYNKDPSKQSITSPKKELSPSVTTPALLYPALYGVKLRQKDLQCPLCKSTNRSRITSVWISSKKEDKVYQLNCGWCNQEWFTSSKLILNKILEEQIGRITEFTKKTGKEFGALIFRTSRGIVLELIQIGEDREIQMFPTRKLLDDEEIMGSFHCVTPDIILLGDNKLISESEVGNHVFSQNGLSEIKNIFTHKFDGKIYKIKAAGLLPFRVTPEHPLLTTTACTTTQNHKRLFSRIKWKLPEEINEQSGGKDGDYLVMPRIKRFDYSTSINLRPFVNYTVVKNRKTYAKRLDLPLNKNTSWLLGMYVAEGSAYVHNRRENHDGASQIHWALNIWQKEYVEKIKNILSELGYSSSMYEQGKGLNIRGFSPVLAKALISWCGKYAKNKKIPDFILGGSEENLESFLDGLLIGDGYLDKRKNRILSTTSQTLAQQTQLAFARLGFSSYIFKRDRTNKESYINKRRIELSTEYTVLISNKSGQNQTKCTHEYMFVPIRKIVKEAYNGMVYNIETRDGTFLVNNIVSHNCHPISDQPSFWDIATFLRDHWEQVSCVSGAKGHLIVMVKTNETIPLLQEDLENWEKEQTRNNTPLPLIAEKYKFLVYRGKPDNLSLIGGDISKTTSLEKLLGDAKGIKNL